MPSSSYRLRRVLWRLWAWDADYGGAEVGRGYALGQRSARWAARSRIRASRDRGAAERDQAKAPGRRRASAARRVPGAPTP